MSKKYIVRPLSQVKEDFREIADFVEEQCSSAIGEHVINKLINEVHSLERMPFRGAVVGVSNNGRQYRRIHYRHYNIYYCVDEEKLEIVIILAIDARRNPKIARNRLKNLQ